MSRALGNVLVAGVLLFTALALNAEGDLWTGTYALDSSVAVDIPAAVEATVAKMNFVIRSMARKRLLQNNVAYERVQISRDASDVTVTFDKQPPMRMPANGKAVKWTSPEGDTSAVSIVERDGALVQTLKGGGGVRTNTFRLDSGGVRLTLDVQTTSEHLPQPVHYTLVYRRTG